MYSPGAAVIDREKNIENGPFAKDGRGVDKPFVVFHDLFTDRQPYARSRICCGPG